MVLGQRTLPAESVSLRSAASDNFVIVDWTDTGAPRVIGEMDRYAAPAYLHEDAIYIHGGQQHQVEKLDWDGKKAYVGGSTSTTTPTPSWRSTFK